MFCMECGGRIEDDYVFCIHCGIAVKHFEEYPSSPAEAAAIAGPDISPAAAGRFPFWRNLKKILTAASVGGLAYVRKLATGATAGVRGLTYRQKLTVIVIAAEVALIIACYILAGKQPANVP